MYKLTVVGGPSAGTAYSMREGENSIGRTEGNDIVLSSSKVSKKHCVLVVDNGRVTVQDNQSSNGTFVNGVLTKSKQLHNGDRVSIGEYVLELTKVQPVAQYTLPRSSRGGASVQIQHHSLPMQQQGNVLPFPVQQQGEQASSFNLSGSATSPDAPTVGFIAKIKFLFEQHIVNFLYRLNETQEWRSILVGMFFFLTIGASLVSIYPVLQRVRGKLMTESYERTLILARQMVDRNSIYLFEKTESKVDVSFIENEPGVVSAYITDMEGRVIAPGRMLNQYLSDSTEAAFAAKSRDLFYEKDTLERRAAILGNLIAVAVPLRVFQAGSGRNETVAIGLVFYDYTQVVFDPSTEALTYIQAFILIAILSAIVFVSMYRLTLKPLNALGDDLDGVLKGQQPVVNKKFKMEEIAPLIDEINVILSRSGGVAGNMGGAGADHSMAIDMVVQSLTLLGEHVSQLGVMIFHEDRKIQYLSTYMEEITGIHNASSGQVIASVARDAAFVAFVDDILTRASSSAPGVVSDDFEFSGAMYRMECVALGSIGFVKGYVLIASRSDG